MDFQDIIDNGFRNIILVFLQMIAIVGWFVFLVKIKDKENYLCFKLQCILKAISILMIYVLLTELIDTNFYLKGFTNPIWYVINILMVFTFFWLVELIEEKQDKIDS